MSDVFEANWKSLSRQLHHLCVQTFGEDLLCELIALPPQAACEAVKEAVKHWLEELVLPEIQKINTERAVSLKSLLAHESDKHSFSSRLASALPKIRRAWDWKEKQWHDKKTAFAIIGQAFQQFLNDAYTGGSQRKQNWQLMDKAMRILQQETQVRADQAGWSEARRNYALRRFEHDLAWLAAELLTYFARSELAHGRLKDVATVETILQYFYDFMPGWVVSLTEDEAEAFATHVPLINIEWESFLQCLHCLECVTRLTDEERQVIELMLEKEITGETDAQLAKRMEMKRGTFLNRFKMATEKLLTCLAEGHD